MEKVILCMRKTEKVKTVSGVGTINKKITLHCITNYITVNLETTMSNNTIMMSSV